MYVAGTFHPPAGINPLLAVSNNLPWTFLFAPDACGRGAADGGCLCLAPIDPAPAVATALVVTSRR
jgi:hypothetical protein